MSASEGFDFRWIAKRYLPKKMTDLLRSVLPESIYYPGYGRTTLSDKKLIYLLILLKECLSRSLEGDLIECGVFRGGSLVEIGRTARRMAPAKTLFGLDTFEGHPYDGPEDVPADNQLVHHKGLFAGNSYERVRQTLRENGIENATLLKGRVEDTIGTLAGRKFCFAHVDLDLYESTRQALAFIEPRLVSGGVIVFDDYGSFDAPGVEKAVSEILPHADIVKTAIGSGEGNQAYWVKP